MAQDTCQNIPTSYRSIFRRNHVLKRIVLHEFPCTELEIANNPLLYSLCDVLGFCLILEIAKKMSRNSLPKSRKRPNRKRRSNGHGKMPCPWLSSLWWLSWNRPTRTWSQHPFKSDQRPLFEMQLPPCVDLDSWGQW